ncbi:STT3 domain-containing protein [Helicobacter sp.]|uniref:STT3 domain-containing protein n=1 Tax=Helicobacter sp. TaxID=218 RepID=UPI00199C2E4F|nr:STT3 domain-containing protein [Helicobacter sp.]MBD5164721.1 general glycosylation pathway protein [Helicobacter sp.]
MRLGVFVSLSIVCYCLCVGVRFYYPFILSAYPQYFYNEALLLNTHDGYFYAQGAKHLLFIAQEFYSNFTWELWQNPQKFFTILNSPNLSQTSPKSANEILSILTAFLAFCLPFNLEQILHLMPGIFGSLVVFPVMALMRSFGVIPCALSGILSGISVSYYNRTLFGYYDTDMLVIVLGLSVGVMILRTWQTQRTRDYAILLVLSTLALGYYANLRYVLLGYILILCSFFLKDLWGKSHKESQIQWILLGLLWTLTLEIFLPKLTFAWIFLGFFLGLGLKSLCQYCKPKALFILFFLGNLGFLLWKLLPNMFSSDYLGYFLASDTQGENFHYLNVLDSIAEVSSIGFDEFAYRVSGGIVWFILGTLGYVWLILAYKRFLIFLPFLALGCFSLVQGLRFSFYATSIFAIGLGFLLYQTQEALRYFKYAILKKILIFGIVFLAILPHLWHIKNYIIAPILEASEAEILRAIDTKSGDFALAWWDYGYYITYFSGLKTFIDGGIHSGKQNFPISLVLSSKEEKISYNVAKMLLNAESLEDYLRQNGIEEGLKNLKTQRNFAKTQKNLYIILPFRMLEIFPNIMRFSSVDLNNGKVPKLDFFALSISENNERISFKNGIYFNKITGKVSAQDFQITIQKSIDLKHNLTQDFDATSALIAIFLPNGKTLLCAESYLESFYFKGLFFENLDSNLFQKVLKNDTITIYKLL